MKRFRLFALYFVGQFLVAALLLGALWGFFWSSATAASRGQTESSTGEIMRLPVPAYQWTVQPAIAPSSKAPSGTTPITGTASITGSEPTTEAVALTTTNEPAYYVVLPGDTLFVIATDHGVTVEAILRANNMSNPDILNVGQVLIIPAPDGTLPDPSQMPVVMSDGTGSETMIVARGTITERMTTYAQQNGLRSPYSNTTWLTYYGRPNIDVMGILGEHEIEDLVPLLRAEAEAYDRANGEHLTVMPAFHLVYGMATKAVGDGSHLAYMEETAVISYIEAAADEGWSVILDVQIGALEPSEAITPALEYLKYPNVHLAIDPEFAMVHAGQDVPGNPIGFVTAEQVNAVQAVIEEYLAAERLPGPRILLVHQFQSNMIVEKEKIDISSYPNVALTLSVDGWGGPWGKISKYNSLVNMDSPFVAFKLFYRWDEPLLLPEEVMGSQPYRGSDFAMGVTPNFIIYQ